MSPSGHRRNITIVKLAPAYCAALVVAIGCGGPNDPFGDPFSGGLKFGSPGEGVNGRFDAVICP